MDHPVVFGSAPTSALRQPTISSDEFYVSLEQLRNGPRNNQQPAESYDVGAIVAGLPAPWDKASAVMCFWDSDDRSNPVNVGAVECAKILVVGDTHHGLRPLARAIDVARQQPWDLIVLPYNRQHVHWFDEAGAGSGRTVFIPCFGIHPMRREVPERRTRGVTLCGQLSHLHVYRRCVLGALRSRGLPVDVHTGSAEFCAQVYSESVVSLNISLNGDFNMRNFEIAAAGGFCLGDPTGLDAAQRPGAVFRDVDDAERIIRHMLAHPEESLAAGRRDQEMLFRDHSAAQQVAALERALAAPKGARFTPPALFHQRLGVYEEMQDMTRRGRIVWEDMQDLPRWAPGTYPGPAV